MNSQHQNKRKALKGLIERADKAYRLRQISLVRSAISDGNQPAGVSFEQMMSDLRKGVA